MTPNLLGYAAVLVDLVASRDHPDRAGLQEAVADAAARVNAVEPCLEPLTATVGDELQGTYPTLSAAIRAVARFRLELIGTVDVRAGIGWGDIEIHDPDRAPFGQDGSAWWSAREALDALGEARSRAGHVRLGASFADDGAVTATARGGLPPPRPPDVDAVSFVRSHLTLLDHALDRLDAVEARIVLGDLDGRATDEIAETVGISGSGVSQRRRRNGLRAIVHALDALHTSP